jgi:putative ABC transport system substrate-binding protein
MNIPRRDFLGLVGAAAAWPLAARAQQPALPVIGYLGIASPEAFAGRLRAFRLGLGEIGYVEGQNVAIEYRWAEGRYDRLPALAADLVRRQVTVIVAPGGIPSALAAKAATATIPTVFETGADPVAVGLVASLNRPGGNVTGVTSLNGEVEPKRLELLHELVPGTSMIARLDNPTSPTAESVTREVQAAARTLGLQVHVLQADNDRDIDAAFAALIKLQAGALMIAADPFFNSRSEQLAALAARHAVPAIAQPHEFPAAGGLMSYGGSISESHRQAGLYVGRILKGEKPADLPVQQVTKVELTINLRTAKTLGLTVPLPLLTRADEVIE